MELNLRALQKLQRDTGFNPDLLEKTFHMTKILSGLFKDKRIGKDFALQGGTALNFIYLDIPRLSVDLDLNFIGSLEKKEMLARRKDIPVTQRPSSYIMERYVLRYKKLSGLPDSIRLEFNFLERVPFIRIVRRSFEHIFEFEKFEINTYTIEEIGAMKTKAMVERLYARDIFDMHRVSRLKMNLILLRKLMILYVLMARKEPDAKDIISRIKQYDGSEITRSVGPFIRRGKEKDLNPAEIKKTLSDFYERMFLLNDSEKQFIDLIKSGKIDLKILFKKENFNPQAEKHPSLIWTLGLD